MSWIVFIILLALLIALWEIQIEGKDGWAKNLPTWKIKNPFQNLINVPTITGYHLFLTLTLLTAFHLPYLGGLPFNLESELLIIQAFIATLLLEDFLWFALNPSWGIRSFFQKNIPWHSGKFLGFPKNYWIPIVLLLLIQFIKLFNL